MLAQGTKPVAVGKLMGINVCRHPTIKFGWFSTFLIKYNQHLFFTYLIDVPNLFSPDHLSKHILMILPFNPLLIPWHKQCRNAIRLLCTHGLLPLLLKLLGVWPCTAIMIVSVSLYLCRSFKEHLNIFSSQILHVFSPTSAISPSGGFTTK